MHLVVLAFIGVINLLCNKVSLIPYVFFFVFRIAQSRTV